MIYNIIMRTRKPDPICVTCEQPFRPKSRKALALCRFCCRECYGQWRATDPTIRAQLVANAAKGKAGWTDASRAAYLAKMSGAKNPAWKGGATFKRNKGNYIGPKYVRCPAAFAPMARTDGYVMEHRLIVARLARRCLDRTEVVHHRDHVTRNNAPGNLELWPSNASHKAAEGGRLVIGAANRLCLMGSARP
jgi:hypothetical protein